MSTTTEPIRVWVIVKRHDVSKSSDGWAELEVTDDGVPYVMAYRTKTAAEARMRELVPAGKNPGTYGGYRVERATNRGMFVIQG